MTEDRQAKRIVPDVTPEILVAEFGVSPDFAAGMIASSRRRYGLGMIFHEYRHSEGAAFVTTRNGQSFRLEIW